MFHRGDIMNKVKIVGHAVMGQMGTLFLAIAAFSLELKLVPHTMLMQQVYVGKELTEPHVARIIWLFVSLVLAFALLYLAYKAKNDYVKFFLAAEGAVFLWQSLGECVWHFGFSRMEGPEAAAYFIMFIALCIYAWRHRSFDWVLWVFILSFMVNWAGHFVMEGTLPLAPRGMAERTWYEISGTVGGILLLIPSLYAVKKAKNVREVLLASELLFTVLGIFACVFGAF